MSLLAEVVGFGCFLWGIVLIGFSFDKATKDDHSKWGQLLAAAWWAVAALMWMVK